MTFARITRGSSVRLMDSRVPIFFLPPRWVSMRERKMKKKRDYEECKQVEMENLQRKKKSKGNEFNGVIPITERQHPRQFPIPHYISSLIPHRVIIVVVVVVVTLSYAYSKSIRRGVMVWRWWHNIYIRVHIKMAEARVICTFVLFLSLNDVPTSFPCHFPLHSHSTRSPSPLSFAQWSSWICKFYIPGIYYSLGWL